MTHIDEGQQGAESDLSGIDVRWQANEQTLVRAEIAASSNVNGGITSSGRAQMLSVEHRSDKLDLRAQYKEVDQEFGLGQQAAALRGIRKFGLDGRYEYSTEVSLNVRASQQTNLETRANRLAAEAGVEYKGDKTSATLGVVHAQDNFADGKSRTSDVLQGGLSRRLFNSALKLRANGSVGLSDENENSDYISSLVLGFDYEVLPEVDIFMEFESAEGADIRSEMTRVGVRASPWNRAQFVSSLTNEMSEFGPRLFANLGLIQGFQVNDAWVVDIGLDQTRTMTDPTLRRFDEETEFAYGSQRDDFTAAFLGTQYQFELWSVNSRLEYRDSDNEKRVSLLSGWYREPSLGRGMSAGLTVYSSRLADNTDSITTNLRLGWSFRPAESA